MLFAFFCRISAQLENEAQLCKLQHVNIVAFLAVVSEDDHCGIVMEYVHHGALDDFVSDYEV